MSEKINYFGKETTKEELNKAFKEEFKKIYDRAVMLTEWYLIFKSFQAYFWIKDQKLAMLYSILIFLVSISNNLYQVKIMINQGKISSETR